jgi:hypothetical protein
MIRASPLALQIDLARLTLCPHRLYFLSSTGHVDTREREIDMNSRSLAEAESLASIARKQARSWRLSDRISALAIKRALIESGWVVLARTIPIGEH